MDRRINHSKVAPDGIRALGGLETYLAATESRKGAMA
jgi:hypothetical protein